MGGGPLCFAPCPRDGTAMDGAGYLLRSTVGKKVSGGGEQRLFLVESGSVSAMRGGARKKTARPDITNPPREDAYGFFPDEQNSAPCICSEDGMIKSIFHNNPPPPLTYPPLAAAEPPAPCLPAPTVRHPKKTFKLVYCKCCHVSNSDHQF